MRLVFGPWIPDQPSVDLAGLTTALNVMPFADSYGEFPSEATFSNALTARCQGAGAFKGSDGTIYNFAGDATALYKASATAGAAVWEDISRTAGGAYTVGSNLQWEFTQFGDYVIATNGSDAPQKFVLGTSTNFASLSGSAPVALHVATVREFVVFGNLPGSNPNRLKWSAFNNAEDYNQNPAVTQSDLQDLAGEGQTIQRIVGGQYGLVLTDRSLWTMQYVGSDLIFQINEAEKDTGTIAPGSVAKYGEQVFYLSKRGFMMWNGQQSMPIGNEQVDRTFADDLDTTYIGRVSAAIDPINKIYAVAYCGAGNAGYPNSLLLYNFTANRWAKVSSDNEFLWVSASLGFTLDQITASLDSLVFSLDDAYWTGGQRVLAGFTSGHAMFTYNGTPKGATIETGDGQLSPEMRSFIRTVAPLVIGSSSSVGVSLGYRNRLVDAVSYTSAQTMDAYGRVHPRNQARFHRLKLTIGGGFDHARGADIDLRAAGKR